MKAKTFIFGIGLGVLGWMLYRQNAIASIDTADGEAGGVLDNFVNVAYDVAGDFMPGNMEISLAGLNQIKLHEGFKANVYKDSAGYPTIGYGHKLTAAERLQGLSTVTAEEAARLLASDVAGAESAVNGMVNVPLTQSQFDALVSFVYNIGAGAFRRSTLLALLNQGKYDMAANQFARWNKAGGLVSQGLSNRRASEMALFKTGQGLMTA